MQSMLMHALSAPWLLVFSIRLLFAVTAVWLCAGIANIALRFFSLLRQDTSPLGTTTLRVPCQQ